LTKETPETLDESLKKAHGRYAKSDRETRWQIFGVVAVILCGTAYLGVYFDFLNLDSSCASAMDWASAIVVRRTCTILFPLSIVIVALVAYKILEEIVYRIVEALRR